MRKAKNKGHQISDKDLENASGGVVNKLIYQDGSEEYTANEYLDITGKPMIWYDGFFGQKSNKFREREDAEKYAIEHGWNTDLHTFKQYAGYDRDKKRFYYWWENVD